MRTPFAPPALVLTSVLASIVGTASANVMYIDLGHPERQSNPLTFNNLTNETQSIANAIDENGLHTGMSIDITEPFFTIGAPSQLGSEAPTGIAAQFGADATDDYLFGHTGPFAGEDDNSLSTIEFGNLDANTIYSFTIFASRSGVNDNREAQYDFTGANNATGLLNASNNDSEVLILAGLLADDSGTITLDISAGPNNDNGNGFYYLGAIRIDTRPVPSPGSLALLTTGGLFITRRKR
ncbi:MAG: hypothetical protein P1U30_09610 [Phycisphaerales bacterium]|nr:hypothetical protein [Phycisphaerales bacterium]